MLRLRRRSRAKTPSGREASLPPERRRVRREVVYQYNDVSRGELAVIVAVAAVIVIVLLLVMVLASANIQLPDILSTSPNGY